MTSTEVATVSPIQLFQRHQSAFTNSLPSHVNRNQWASVVVGALNSAPEVRQAAANDPNRFLAALLQAARLGLEPGTEQFYLVPNAPKKGMPRVILPVVGYQGLVELMYRAGAVASVIVECVYSKDGFEYVPGRDDRPHHTIDWLSVDRGALVLVYAYAVMKDGATSKVVVLNESDVKRAMASSAAASSEYGPWKKHPQAMWMKTAVRQLAKWVPTSAEYRRQQLRDVQQVQDERERRAETVQVDLPPLIQAGPGERIDPLTGEVELDIMDADVVDVETGEIIEPTPAPAVSSGPKPLTRTTGNAILAEFKRLGVERPEVDAWLPALGVPVVLTQLLQPDAEELLGVLKNLDRDRLAELAREAQGQ